MEDPIRGSSKIYETLNDIGLSLKLPKKKDLLYIVDNNLYRNKIHSYELEQILTISQLYLYESIKNNIVPIKLGINNALREKLSYYENTIKV